MFGLLGGYRLRNGWERPTSDVYRNARNRPSRERRLRV